MVAVGVDVSDFLAKVVFGDSVGKLFQAVFRRGVGDGRGDEVVPVAAHRFLVEVAFVAKVVVDVCRGELFQGKTGVDAGAGDGGDCGEHGSGLPVGEIVGVDEAGAVEGFAVG